MLMVRLAVTHDSDPVEAPSQVAILAGLAASQLLANERMSGERRSLSSAHGTVNTGNPCPNW